MPLDVANLAVNIATVVIPVDEETVVINYRPAKITTKRVAAVDPTRTDDDGVDEMSVFFAEIIDSWDIMKGGEPLPIEPAEIAALPLFMLRLIFKKIMEDVSDGTAGKASPGSSSPGTRNSARSRSGTRS